MKKISHKTYRTVFNGTKMLLAFAALFLWNQKILPVEPAFAGNSATQVVEKLHEKLLEIMKQAKMLGYSGRYKKLAPVVTTSYDLSFMARVVVGRQWRQFSDQQKSTFVEMFTKLSIATHAARFDGYSGQHFEIRTKEKLHNDLILIRSVLIKPNGEEIELDYILHHSENRWRIINVIADGVSDLSLKRAEYSNYLKKHGFDALIEKLKKKINQYAE